MVILSVTTFQWELKVTTQEYKDFLIWIGLVTKSGEIAKPYFSQHSLQNQ